MTIRQELLKQGEHKLDKLLERTAKFLEAATSSEEMSELICRILSTDRNTSIRQRVMRRFADAAEAEIIAKFNNQADLPLDDDKKESL